MKTVLNLKTITLEIKVRDRNVKNELTISGEYNGSCGQCLDTIKKDILNGTIKLNDIEQKEVLNIIQLWEKYHLKEIPQNELENLNKSIEVLENIIAAYDKRDITEIKEEIKEYLLNNIEQIEYIVDDINNWNGELEEYKVYENDNEFFEIYFDNPFDLIRVIYKNDNYSPDDDYIQLDIYGNLISYTVSEYQELFKNDIDIIIDSLLDNLSHISLDSELLEIINKIYN